MPRRVNAARGHIDELYAAPGDLNYSYGPKDFALASVMADSVEATSTFSVTYSGFDPTSQAAFQAAVNIWANTISSPVPIRIEANWVPLSTGVLGSAGPTVVCQPSGGLASTWYAAALADKLHGTAFCAAAGGETAEIVANFNSSFTDWEFGTSGVGVAGKYNFMTVVLHEIGHGLGFFGLFRSSGGVGDLSDVNPSIPGVEPSIYDRFAVTGAGALLLGIARPSTTLHTQLTSSNTFYNGTNATARNAATWPKLETANFATTYGVSGADHGWLSGSSYSHIDDTLYSGTANGLMTWALNSNEAYTDVGPIVKGMFQDQGWAIAANVPGTATLVAPSGTITNTRPDFVWTAVTGATAYELYVAPVGGSAIVDTTYSAATLCNASTCTLPAQIQLTAGQSYNWWVRASNGSGSGPWSTVMTFAVSLPVPGQSAVLEPSGSSVAERPTYSWAVASHTSHYLLYVSTGGNLVFQQWHLASQVCGPTTCSVTPANALAPLTTYAAYVQTWNSGGYGPWSTARTFTTGMVPAAPTLLAPSGSVVTPAPTYSWNASTGATSYYLWVQRSGSDPALQVTYPSSSICPDATCSVTPRTELADGTYAWWVQPISSFGAGPWSQTGGFIVEATIPPATTLVWPLAGISGAVRPTYKWNRVNNATWYYLWVDEPGTPPVIQSWHFSGDVCTDSTCAVAPDVPLTSGASYRWYVQTWSSRGAGPWTAATQFSIATASPIAATLVSPTGSLVSSSPTYTWNRVDGASWYYLWVQMGESTPVIQLWYRADEVCGVTTCAATPAVTLTSGQTFHFWVQTWNDVGFGPWSSTMSFSR